MVTYAAKSSSATGVLTPSLTKLQKLVFPLIVLIHFNES